MNGRFIRNSLKIGTSIEYVKVAQSCQTICDPMDCSVHGILQTRILEWVAVPFSRGSSQPRQRTQVSCIAGGFFTSWPTREALNMNTENLDNLTYWKNYWVSRWISHWNSDVACAKEEKVLGSLWNWKRVQRFLKKLKYSYRISQQSHS